MSNCHATPFPPPPLFRYPTLPPPCRGHMALVWVQPRTPAASFPRGSSTATATSVSPTATRPARSWPPSASPTGSIEGGHGRGGAEPCLGCKYRIGRREEEYEADRSDTD